MRGVGIRATADYGHLHPDVTNYIVGTLGMLYALDRRRFILRYPDEAPPPEIKPLGGGWLIDLVDLHSVEMDAISRQSAQK